MLKLKEQFKCSKTQERFGRDSNCGPFGMSLAMLKQLHEGLRLLFSTAVPAFILLNTKLSCCFDAGVCESLTIQKFYIRNC